MTDIDKILAERAKTHGDYTEHAQCTQDIMLILMLHRNWIYLSPDQKETLHMIAHKMGRVVTGNPNVADHWDDIAGYAKLSADRVRVRLNASLAEFNPNVDTETTAMEQFVKTTIYKPEPRQAKAEYPAGHGFKPELEV